MRPLHLFLLIVALPLRQAQPPGLAERKCCFTITVRP